MKPLVLHPAARNEMLEAAAFYEACRPGLGKAFADAVAQAFDALRENPLSFPEYKSTGLRRCLAHRFPYLLFFRVRREDVWVVAVAHAARKPDYWKDRLSAQQSPPD